jgi:hypothetical protein
MTVELLEQPETRSYHFLYFFLLPYCTVQYVHIYIIVFLIQKIAGSSFRAFSSLQRIAIKKADLGWLGNYFQMHVLLH